MDGQRGTSSALAAASLLGVGSVVAAFVTGVPGNGLYVVAAVLAGLLAALVLPRWTSWPAMVAGISAALVVASVLAGSMSLLGFAIPIIAVPATAGWLVGWVAARVRAAGVGIVRRDPRVLLAGAGAAATMALVLFIASAFGSNPP